MKRMLFTKFVHKSFVALSCKQILNVTSCAASLILRCGKVRKIIILFYFHFIMPLFKMLGFLYQKANFVFSNVDLLHKYLLKI